MNPPLPDDALADILTAPHTAQAREQLAARYGRSTEHIRKLQLEPSRQVMRASRRLGLPMPPRAGDVRRIAKMMAGDA